MKVKIISNVPVAKEYRPVIGQIYDVIDCNYNSNIRYISVNGEKVGVFLRYEAVIVDEVSE